MEFQLCTLLHIVCCMCSLNNFLRVSGRFPDLCVMTGAPGDQNQINLLPSLYPLMFGKIWVTPRPKPCAVKSQQNWNINPVPTCQPLLVMHPKTSRYWSSTLHVEDKAEILKWSVWMPCYILNIQLVKNCKWQKMYNSIIIQSTSNDT